jgi:Skp family chaperone for outer membrane proteins
MNLMALMGFGGMLVLITTMQAQQPGTVPTPGAQPPQQTSRPTIAVFNMAAVMKDYGKAKYQVYLINEERKTMSVDLLDKRGKYVKLEQEIRTCADPKLLEQLKKKQVDLSREIQDRDGEINRALNDKATAVISALYDEIKTVVDKTAEMNGYHIVFAYPDATSADEMKSAYVKELKLKPPAAQPFYVARHVDITGVVVQTLNTWYPSLPVPTAPPAANVAPAQGQGAVPGSVPGPAPGTVPGRP